MTHKYRVHFSDLSSALSGSSFLRKEPHVTKILSCCSIYAKHSAELAAREHSLRPPGRLCRRSPLDTKYFFRIFEGVLP